MSPTARRIRSVPVRTATDTWTFIVDLITSGDGAMRAELGRAGNTAAMLIAEEHTAEAPIILLGRGTQVRLYTLHGDDAVDGAAANELPLTLSPSSGRQLALPATGSDFDLAVTGTRGLEHIAIYDPTFGGASADPSANGQHQERIHVNLEHLEA